MLGPAEHPRRTSVTPPSGSARERQRGTDPDAVCWALIRELADCPAPLLDVDEGGLPFRQRRVRLTPSGDEVLAGRLDHVRRNGIDRWIGGVRLAGHTTPWRYDERLETLLPSDRGRG
jgi:hypothetical protein